MRSLDPAQAEWRKSSYSSGAANNCVECASAVWQKSSYSNTKGGECVEVAELPSSVAVRDSQYPGLGHLTFPAGEWAALLHAASAERL